MLPVSIVADIRYSYVVDQQPIGRLLFRQFCQDKKPSYHRYNLFLDAIEKYEIEMDENRTELAKDLFEQYLKREGSEVVDILNDSLIAQCEERLGTGGKELFVEIAQTVKNFLAGEPFSAFQTSFYFYRYNSKELLLFQNLSRFDCWLFPPSRYHTRLCLLRK